MTARKRITGSEIKELAKRLAPLTGVQLKVLQLPRGALSAFEPSQIGTIVGDLMDACIPELASLVDQVTPGLKAVGLSKHEGVLGDREGYPDYLHDSGNRVELKLLYRDPQGVQMKKPPTPREPSARITQKVTTKNVQPDKDVLMVVAYELKVLDGTKDMYSPTIIDVGLFSMIDCIDARDDRLIRNGGKWFGNLETPAVLSALGEQKVQKGEPVDGSQYGRKESEGKHFNEDTNFGKLKRVPYEPLQRFLKKHGAEYTGRGHWPQPWKISADAKAGERKLL